MPTLHLTPTYRYQISNTALPSGLYVIVYIQKHLIDVCVVSLSKSQIVDVARYTPENNIVDGDFLASILPNYKRYNVDGYIAALDEPRYMLVPQVIGTQQEIYQLFSVQHFVEANEAILHQGLPFGNISAYFAAKNATMQLLNHYMPAIKVIHAQICAVQHHIGVSKKQRVDINVAHQYFTLSISNPKLQLCNSYEYQTPVDILFQLLNAKEVYGLDDDVSIFICGINSDSVVQQIKPYVNNTALCQRPAGLLYISDMTDAQHQSFISLYQIVKACVL